MRHEIDHGVMYVRGRDGQVDNDEVDAGMVPEDDEMKVRIVVDNGDMLGWLQRMTRFMQVWLQRGTACSRSGFRELREVVLVVEDDKEDTGVISEN